ncbi:MAG: guanine-specific ribonuclease [Amycolatopsis sp.]|jgi:ribonuclease T1|uniref:ribonuclease domain-containing protein n=1 Tax=Amycolatopsis sp. TaxID=37632 RepID=UPI002624FE7E|nr:ribonuclease domain-containing protein [Amycolatopsis sp.]MCU1681166.1 guanine-specific ribonuclease [Amycolatopsis sp.]
MVNRRRITAALIGLIVLVIGGWAVKNAVSDNKPQSSSSVTGTQLPQNSHASTPVPGFDSGLQVKALSSLPSQAADTWKLIRAGGPFPYPRNDNVVYQNRNKVLPIRQADFYHEFTVKTLGSSDRGARRLITGQGNELFYTADHYDTFVVVDPNR